MASTIPVKLSWFGRVKKSIVIRVLGEDNSEDQLGEDSNVSAPRIVPLERSAGSTMTKSSRRILSQESARFDENWLSLVQTRARSEGRRTAASIGCGLGAIGLVPFGPIAMCVCAIAGLMIGFLVGFLYDMQRARVRESVAEKELGRMTYLVRFAADQISRRLFTHASHADAEYCLDLLETVVLEFKPFVEVAHLSPVVRKKLALFHSFLRRQAVMQCLWMYVNGFLSKWASSLTAIEFVQTCRDMLATLVETERKLGLVEPQERLEVIIRVEEFLSQPVIQRFLELHARQSLVVTGSNMEAVLARDIRLHLHSVASPSHRKTSSVYHMARGSPEPLQDGDEFQDVFQESGEFGSPLGPASPVARKSRAFFRSLKDFMDFDLGLKHRMPITVAESQFLYDKEAEALDAPGWELTVNRPHIQVLRYLSSEPLAAAASPPVLIRAYATIRNVSIANVFYHIVDPEMRPSWDTNFSHFSLLPAQEGEVLYCTLNAPFGVTPRDFLQYRRCIVEDETVTILMRSAVHAEKPVAPGFIRAETYISGYVLRQRGADAQLFLMTQTDIKGLIPKWIVNTMAAKAPAQWIENLAKSCSKLSSRRFNNDASAMAEFLTQFTAKYATDTVTV